MATTKKTTTTKTTKTTKATEAPETTAPVAANDSQLTKDQQCNLFRAIIDCYGVQAAYGANRRMTIDKPFKDWAGVFGEKNYTYTQPEIAPYWNAVALGTWTVPTDNPYVISIMELVDWDHI